MKKNLFSRYKEVLVVLVGELALSLLVVLGFLVFRAFDYTVLTGLLLGVGVTVLNLFILSVSVNRAVDKYLAMRGTGEMDEDEAESFAAANSESVRLAASGTYLLRTLLMVGVLVGAFLLGDYFNVIATVIPLLAYRPIIYVSEYIKVKMSKPSAEDTPADDRKGE